MDPGVPFFHILVLILFATLLSAGQVLFKVAALAAPPLNSLSSVGSLLLLPSLWGALLVYGSATLLWIWLMQEVPLSRGYPFAALGFVLVPAAGVLFFSERVSGLYVAGAALIVVGLLLISQS